MEDHSGYYTFAVDTQNPKSDKRYKYKKAYVPVFSQGTKVCLVQHMSSDSNYYELYFEDNSSLKLNVKELSQILTQLNKVNATEMEIKKLNAKKILANFDMQLTEKNPFLYSMTDRNNAATPVIRIERVYSFNHHEWCALIRDKKGWTTLDRYEDKKIVIETAKIRLAEYLADMV